MDAGKLRNRITIQQRTLVQDSYGQPIESWADFATVWAEIRSLSGRESLVASAVQGVTNYEINIRFKAGITQSMRVAYKSRYLDIQSIVTDFDLKKKTTLFCTEGLSDG
jgi:SPP1 family predicted phage head-tail adaptor